MNHHPIFLRILPAAACCLAAGMLDSCIVSTARHFKHMGQEGQCILPHLREDSSLELYRDEDKVYMKGALTAFREYDPDLTASIDRHDRTYRLTRKGEPRRTVYKELTLMRHPTLDVRNTGKFHEVEQWHPADSFALAELPEGAVPYFSRLRLSPHAYSWVKDGEQWHTAIVTEELSANVHAIYAYPMAAVCYVGIDAPAILVQAAALPFVMCYAGIERCCRQNEASADLRMSSGDSAPSEHGNLLP